MRVLLYCSSCIAVAGITVAGIAVAGIAVAVIAVAGIAVAGIAVAGIAVAGIAVAGIEVAVVPQKALLRQVFRPQDALSAVWQRARWRHAICAVLQIGFVLCAICISCLGPIFHVLFLFVRLNSRHSLRTHFVHMMFYFIIQIYEL